MSANTIISLIVVAVLAVAFIACLAVAARVVWLTHTEDRRLSGPVTFAINASASPAHVQALLDQAVAELEQTTKSGALMVKSYGTDVSRWPAGHWVNGLALLAAARVEAGQLKPPPAPFTVAIAGIPRAGQTLKAVTT